MRISCLPALALLLALPLAAEHSVPGIQAAVVFPQNDLRSNADGALGLAFGVHLGVNLGDGNELRPRLDYVQCDTRTFHALVLSTTSRTAHGVGLGADYLLYLEGAKRGAYLVAGAGLAWWSASNETYGNTHATSPYVILGAGYRFDSALSVEMTYGLSRFRDTAGTAGSIQAGFTYRF